MGSTLILVFPYDGLGRFAPVLRFLDQNEEYFPCYSDCDQMEEGFWFTRYCCRYAPDILSVVM